MSLTMRSTFAAALFVLIPASPALADLADLAAAGGRYPGVSPFEASALDVKRRDALRRFLAGDVQGASALLDALTVAAPNSDEVSATIAFVRTGRHAPLRATPVERPPPAIVEDGIARVSTAHSYWSPTEALVVSRFAFPEPRRPAPVASPMDLDRGAALLTRLFARGQAAGNHGDLYDNRDRGHSDFVPARRAPQAAAVVYDDDARRRGMDYGLNEAIRHEAVVFGNSSTAITSGPRWRSLPRHAMTTAEGPARLAQQYAANHVYIYPEHRDHDPERGDLFPANTPYLITTQGSSGSDQKALRAVGAILAALPPDTKEHLRVHGLIAPAVQVVLRRALAETLGVDPLDGRAHPSAFDLTEVPLERFVRVANAMTPDSAPPGLAIAMKSAAAIGPGPAAFGDGLSETLFVTPAAVAQVFRGAPQRRRYVLEATVDDAFGRAAVVEWTLLRGDPARVLITPLTSDGRRVEVEVGWHDAVTAPGRDDLRGLRIDVGAFAHAGEAKSAPAFFSVAFPPGQKRRYDEHGRPLVIDHNDPDKRTGYADPAIFPTRDWRDEFHYDEAGSLVGWTRISAKGAHNFDAAGFRLLQHDPDSRTALLEQIAYPMFASPDGLRRVEQRATGVMRRCVFGRTGARPECSEQHDRVP